MRKNIEVNYKKNLDAEGFNYGNIASEFGVNEKYITFKNQPYIPITGEFHFSRYSCDDWGMELRKMLAQGLNSISVYVFWNHHERKCGVFDFTGDNDIKSFLSECKTIGLKVVLRIGPWCHGEVRHGGFPEYLWLVPGRRKTTALYMRYVKRFWEKLYEQIKDFCDGDTVMGIQLENEYPGNISHIYDLRKLAEEIGFKTPFFTMTAWPTNCPTKDFVCMFGGYPEAPWTQNKKPLKNARRFAICKGRTENEIGEDIIKVKKEKVSFDNLIYAGCEVGTGNQVTQHRRPLISSNDGYGVAFAKFASGMNWMGYYMYHGGRNPRGTLLQESRRTFYPNNYPIIDYDFQAPISKDGRIRKHADKLRLLHLFISTWDNELPLTQPFFDGGAEMPYISVRSLENRGYVFISNYERGFNSKNEDIDLDIHYGDNQISLPTIPVERNAMFFFPYNYEINGYKFDYILAQPITKVQNGQETHLYLMKIYGIEPTLSINGDAVKISGETYNLDNDCGQLLLHFLDEIQALSLYNINNNIIYSDSALITDNTDNNAIIAEMYNNDNIETESIILSYKDSIDLESIDINEIPPIRSKYDSYLYSNGIRQYYSMKIAETILKNYDDVEVVLDFIGLNMQIFHEGVLIDDYFNTDGKCVIRLKRIKKELLRNNELIIKACAATLTGIGNTYNEINIPVGEVSIAVNSINPICYKKISF